MPKYMEKDAERNKTISSELLAAYLEGNATAEETGMVLQSLYQDEALREIVELSQLVDKELGMEPCEHEVLPMEAVAADCMEHNRCGLLCEQYVLRKLGLPVDEEEMSRVASEEHWLKPEGMPLFQIGRNLELQGLQVTRRFKCSIEDIAVALDRKCGVIVAVDGGELTGDRIEEIGEDFYRMHIPDHAVVVTAYDEENQLITLYDPNTGKDTDRYRLTRFLDAWADSKNYLITINHNTMCEYNPCPIDVKDVELHESLNELREAIAENAHEIWGLERKRQGWTYGPKRDDDKKHNPCMVPYSELPETEKVFDRDMAMDTLKLIKKLGYDIVKTQDTDLYRMWLERIRQANEEDKFYCPHCKEKDKKMTPVYKRQVFCDVCGHEIDINWGLYD